MCRPGRRHATLLSELAFIDITPIDADILRIKYADFRHFALRRIAFFSSFQYRAVITEYHFSHTTGFIGHCKAIAFIV
jgi:hypothetical protein